jgi:glycerol uptake facilitator-like aquaporin
LPDLLQVGGRLNDYIHQNLLLIIIGAHINPAVSISLMTVRKLKPLQCVFYVVGQILGAFLGAALIYLVYWSQFNEFDGGIRQITGLNGTGDIFFTMPGKGVPHWNAFVDQFISTSLLLIFNMAVSYVR